MTTGGMCNRPIALVLNAARRFHSAHKKDDASASSFAYRESADSQRFYIGGTVPFWPTMIFLAV